MLHSSSTALHVFGFTVARHPWIPEDFTSIVYPHPGALPGPSKSSGDAPYSIVAFTRQIYLGYSKMSCRLIACRTNIVLQRRLYCMQDLHLYELHLILSESLPEQGWARPSLGHYHNPYRPALSSEIPCRSSFSAVFIAPCPLLGRSTRRSGCESSKEDFLKECSTEERHVHSVKQIDFVGAYELLPTWAWTELLATKALSTVSMVAAISASRPPCRNVWR